MKTLIALSSEDNTVLPGRNKFGVPQYPRGHAGRLLIVAAAIDTLKRPTASSVATLTGLSKGNIDRYALTDLRAQFGVNVNKTGPVYNIEDWGKVLRPAGVRECLTVLLDRTTIQTLSK